MQIPESLRQAIEAVTQTATLKQHREAAQALSQQYRERHAQGRAPHLRGEQAVNAYLLLRFPATYAALFAALQAISYQLPDFSPGSLLDLGAGPATGSFAAAALWPNLREITLVEQHQEMVKAGKQLIRSASPITALRDARWLQEDLLQALESPLFPAQIDIALLGSVIGELPADRSSQLIQTLLKRAKVVVIVEPGTPRGFQSIRALRAQGIEQGAQVIAPCPHDSLCPLPEGDWCHFAQRLNRPRFQRLAKEATLAHEDEKFSYVALSLAHEGVRPQARVIRHPQTRKGLVTLDLCTHNGLSKQSISKREVRYAQAKDLHWGETFSEIEPSR